MRRSKWGNKITVVDGTVCRSKKEASRWQTLKIFEAAGEITELEAHPRFELVVNNIKVCVYEADAKYRNKGASKLTVEDTKGLDRRTGRPVITPEAKIKHKLFKILYPEYDFQIYA